MAELEVRKAALVVAQRQNETAQIKLQIAQCEAQSDCASVSSAAHERTKSWVERQARHTELAKTENVIPAPTSKIEVKPERPKPYGSHFAPIVHKPPELPSFDGNVTEWIAFRAEFNDTSPMFSDVNNVSRIRRALKGDARTAVKSIMYTVQDPRVIMDALERQFGDPDEIVLTELHSVKRMPRLAEDNSNIASFAAHVANAVATIKSLGQDKYLHAPELVNRIVDKLNLIVRYEWSKYRRANPSSPDLVAVSEFLNEISIAAKRIIRRPTHKLRNAADTVFVERKSRPSRHYAPESARDRSTGSESSNSSDFNYDAHQAGIRSRQKANAAVTARESRRSNEALPRSHAPALARDRSPKSEDNEPDKRVVHTSVIKVKPRISLPTIAHAERRESREPAPSESKLGQKSAELMSSRDTCPICRGNHLVSTCTQFTEASISERWELVKEARLCILCLNAHARSFKCRYVACGEGQCEARHHRLLHGRSAVAAANVSSPTYAINTISFAPNEPSVLSLLNSSESAYTPLTWGSESSPVTPRDVPAITTVPTERSVNTSFDRDKPASVASTTRWIVEPELDHEREPRSPTTRASPVDITAAKGHKRPRDPKPVSSFVPTNGFECLPKAKHFSEFAQLVRSTAEVLVAAEVENAILPYENTETEMNKGNLILAEISLIRRSQLAAFPEEMKSLEAGQAPSKNSPLSRITVELDEYGVIVSNDGSRRVPVLHASEDFTRLLIPREVKGAELHGMEGRAVT
ncbi:uncharacterized protein LOC125234209 [Leguminivora glycinivorella]|uniref:uncharacterized protein LOC125234209 n=1 Tax=Leguminivora glycinivorella TaxID=1035111 RepID=UPI00200E80CE|nr:uncharacterized protein LOC125234209 [Leguminivora glycinivorella]